MGQSSAPPPLLLSRPLPRRFFVGFFFETGSWAFPPTLTPSATSYTNYVLLQHTQM